jgi:hypothetical protein
MNELERQEWNRAYANGEVSEAIWKAMTTSPLPEVDDQLARLEAQMVPVLKQRAKDDIKHFVIFGELPRIPEENRRAMKVMRDAVEEADEYLALLDDVRNGTVGRYGREQDAKKAALALAPGARWREVDERLRQIPTEEYAARLAGVEFVHGRAQCPFHEGVNTYALGIIGGLNFNCFACGAGGTIYDFAAKLWGVEPRGDGFKQLRSRLAEVFGV